MALFRLNFVEILDYIFVTNNVSLKNNHFIYYNWILLLKQLLIFVNDFIIQFSMTFLIVTTRLEIL